MFNMTDRNDSKAQLAFEDGLTIKTKRPPYGQQRMLQAAAILLLLAAIGLLVALVIVSNDRSRTTTDLNECIQEKEETCYSAHCVKTAGAVISSMNMDADPCEDFYEYSCGGWMKTHSIPEANPSLSSFELLNEELQVTLKGLFKRPKVSSEPASIGKVKDFYASCVDLDAIEARDAEPLTDMLTALGGWPVLGNQPGGNWQEAGYDFESLWSTLATNDGSCLIDAYVSGNAKNSRQNILMIDQPSLGMTSRDYFLNEERFGEEKQAYFDYMVNIAVALGGDRPQVETEMRDVLDFETQVANLTVPDSERRDPEAMYHMYRLNQLDDEVPHINFRRYFDAVLEPTDAVADDEPLVNYSPQYIREVAEFIWATPPRTVVNYMLWRYVKQLVPALGDRFQEIQQRYYKVLKGTSTPTARWRNCVDTINSAMKFATGRMYVAETFSEESKTNTQRMISRLKASFKGFLATNEWMDEETKQAAAEKIDGMMEQIGYPDWIMDDAELDKKYVDVNFTADDYFGNFVQKKRNDAKYFLTKLRIPVDTTEWQTGPAVVNAFYSARRNTIIFPAGILQPPFYHEKSPDYLNYGGIGMVIGHEITHGFDDQGRHYDKVGNIVPWWSNASVVNFKERAQCIVDQYSSYIAAENGMNLNGRLTQGENIADNGGLKQSFNAYLSEAKANENIQRLPGIDLNEEQLLYVNFAQVWCGLFRPEDIISKILSGQHSLNRYRVVGTLHNSEDFARVFDCPAESFMNSKKKCVIW